MSEDRLIQNVKDLTIRNDHLEDRNKELGKMVEEQNQTIHMGNLENDSLRNQLRLMNEQYSDLLRENEHAKSDVLRLKSNLMEVESNYKTSQMSLDRATLELRQVNEALRRTETALEVHIIYNFF